MQAQQRGCHLCPSTPPNHEGEGLEARAPSHTPFHLLLSEAAPEKQFRGKPSKENSKLEGCSPPIRLLRIPAKVASDPGQGRPGSEEVL